jgi:flavin reductase (DIM6/NTAB) family NADH-FMN oxidoreductase RutF
MQIDPADLSPRDAYFTLTACLIPRPVAWTSTVDSRGNANLAPFSFFGGVASRPMTVMVSIGRRRGAPKDTSANLLATGEAVVHIPTRPLAEKMVATSAEVAADVDEFHLAGLTPVPATKVGPPRVAEAAIALETVMRQHIEVGDTTDLFLLEVVHLHLDDAFVVDGRPDASRLQAVGRLGGALYCDTGDVFDVQRPT